VGCDGTALVKTEIDEVGLQALIDGVIEGSGFGVEILYLDRSEGVQWHGKESLVPVRIELHPRTSQNLQGETSVYVQ
jgi:hypothetical protein